MVDASLRSKPSGAPAIRGVSLGAKFVGLTAGLILLLSATAFISLRNSAETVRQIRSVVDFAIPAYGALARSHIRSLEQAVELRRSLLLAEDPAVSNDAIERHVQAFIIAQGQFQREIANAGQLLQQQYETLPDAVATDLERLIATLGGLSALTADYERQASACLAAIQTRSLPKARELLTQIDGLRDELNGRLEDVRAGLFAVLQTTSREAQAAQARARLATIVVFVVSSILGLGVAGLGAVRLIRAIRRVVRGAEAVAGGNLETRIEIASRDEIGRLAASFNRMTEGLRMRERIREIFGKYVDRRIAEQLIQSQERLAERGERRDVAIMFCDLAGFTALSEHVEAERLVQFLNAYFSLMAGPITATGGVIDKYIGDAVMAYWCPPFVPREEVARRSAEAALLCLAEIPALAAAASEIFGSGHPYQPRIRIGIASGESIAGCIGAADRRNYTVIGDPVNLACRLEGTNRVYGTANLVCCRTAKALRATFELREVDTVLLPGLDVPEILIEILGRIGEVSAAQTELRDEYERGLEAYRSADWQAAFHQFAYCLDLSPEDGPTRTMLKRIERLAAMPATAGSWSGVWRLSKDDLL